MDNDAKIIQRDGDERTKGARVQEGLNNKIKFWNLMRSDTVQSSALQPGHF